MVTPAAVRAVPSIWRTVAIAAAGLLLPLLWPGLLRHLFDRLSPMVGQHAGSWPASLTTLHLGADALIGLAYTFISAVLAYIVYQHRQVLPFDWVVLAFGLFIVACGSTHFMHVLVEFLPVYWLDGYLRGVTAVVSVATAVALPSLVPRIAQLLNAERDVAAKQQELERANQALQATASRAEVLAALGEALQTATTSEEAQLFALHQLAPALGADAMVVVQVGPDGLAVPTVWGQLPPPVAETVSSGRFTVTNLPLVHQVMATHQAMYLDDYAQVPNAPPGLGSRAFGAQPIFSRSGAVVGVVTVWRATALQGWTGSERDLITRAASTIGLVLERTEAVRTLAQQNAELLTQAQILRSFAELSRELGLENDRYALIRRALAIVREAMPPSCAVYLEPEGDRWVTRVQLGELGSDALQEIADIGAPYGTPVLLRPWTTGRPLYHDRSGHEGAVPTLAAGHIYALAALPVFVAGVPIGIFGIGVFEDHLWTVSDRAMLETVMHSLNLALERAEGARRLQEERAMLEIRTGQLSAANEELEAFSYSASHDLRTPVRHVLGFADLAVRALNQEQPEKVHRHLGVIRQEGERMNAMIDAMLTLSRTVLQEPVAGRVDLAVLVAQAQRDAQAEYPRTPVRWVLQPLPEVWGDARLLQQVMTNLLSNAVKYSGIRSTAEVRVWAEESASEWTVHVRDNGVGFDMGRAQRLFGAFQRLHSQEEFQGTGVGLATVKRILLKHHGRIAAKSEPDRGATFSLTLPKEAPRT